MKAKDDSYCAIIVYLVKSFRVEKIIVSVLHNHI